MIKSIRLLNWRSHADTKLEFNQGTNLLVGAMGAGKSSVMDAISFALFGTFPALKREKLNLKDIFRLNEEKASVILEFESNGSLFRVERELVRGKHRVESEARLFRDGSMLDSGPSAVTTYVSNALGVDYDLFTRAIYSEQNNIDYFLTLNPGKRKQEIDALLGLDRFESARASAVTVVNRLRSDRKLLEERFRPEALEQARKALADYQAQLESARARLNELAALCEEKGRSLQQSEKELAEGKRRKEAHDALSKEKSRQEGALSALRAELAGKTCDAQALGNAKKSLSGKKAFLDSAKAELAAVDSKISSLSKEAGGIEAMQRRAVQAVAELERAKKEISGLLGSESLAQVEERKASMESEAQSMLAEHKSLLMSIKETEELVSRLKPGLARCPLCDSELGEKGTTHVIDEKNLKAGEQKAAVKGLEAGISGKRKRLEELSLQLRKAASLQNSIAILEKDAAGMMQSGQRHAELAQALAAGKAKKGELDARMASLNSEMQSLMLESRRLEELSVKHARLDETEKAYAECASKLAALGFDEQAFEMARAAAEAARLAMDGATREKSHLETDAKRLGEMAVGKRSELEQLESTAREVTRLEMLEGQLAIYRDALLETQTTLRSSLADAINAAMGEVWRIFYPYRNYPSVRLSVTEKDYLLEVLERDSWKPLESMASGGERACAALALRVALAVVLTPNLSWLILDEPTHNLDAEAVSLLSETLQTRVPEVVKQTFVITHEEGLMGADFASSHRLSRDKSGSGATKAERI